MNILRIIFKRNFISVTWIVLIVKPPKLVVFNFLVFNPITNITFASNHDEVLGTRFTLPPWTTRIPDKILDGF